MTSSEVAYSVRSIKMIENSTNIAKINLRVIFHTSMLSVESFEQFPSSSGRVTSKLLCA